MGEGLGAKYGSQAGQCLQAGGGQGAGLHQQRQGTDDETVLLLGHRLHQYQHINGYIYIYIYFFQTKMTVYESGNKPSSQLLP